VARRASTSAGATPAVAALVAAGVAHRVHVYDHVSGASSYGLEAAEALGVEPERIFKTLVVVDAAERLAVGVVPVTATLDLKALATALGERRVAMADPAVAERRTGYVVGGISPFGQKARHPMVVDETAELWDTVYVSGGRRGLEVELAPVDLAAVTGATFAPIARADRRP
jgi:Cys-tRNA(Pro)/Cys-tRNA(Cys) deacylase